MNIIPITLGAKPGIQRDGTVYNSNHFTEGQFTRFYHGWPQKMLGWQSILTGIEEVVGSLFPVPNSRSYDIYEGRPSSLRYFKITNDGDIGPEVQVTPVAGFSINQANLWSFTSTTLTPLTDTRTIVVAQVGHTLNDITNEDEVSPHSGVFYGFKGSSDAFQQILDGDGEPVVASGGVIATPDNVLVVYGNRGISWCRTSDITDWSPWTPIGSTKCCAALNYQGSLLLWTLNGIYRANYDASQNTFSIQEISPNISIWSAKSIVVYQNIVYWVGKGQFYVFNGTVSNLYNNMNKNWFYNNINKKYKSKVSAFVDEQNDEIWFLYPRNNEPGQDTVENSHAVIYYPHDQVWADTAMPRSCGLSLSTYDYRIMPSTKLYNSANGNSVIQTYPMFQHEYGFDDVFNGNSSIIKSTITYPIKDFFSAQPSSENNICMQTFRIEPDFILEPDKTMIANVVNQMYAQSTPVVNGPYPFDLSTEYIDVSPTQGRLVAIQFVCDILGGYFEAGKTLHGIQKGASAA